MRAKGGGLVRGHGLRHRLRRLPAHVSHRRGRVADAKELLHALGDDAGDGAVLGGGGRRRMGGGGEGQELPRKSRQRAALWPSVYAWMSLSLAPSRPVQPGW